MNETKFSPVFFKVRIFLTLNTSEKTRDRAIVTIERQQEVKNKNSAATFSRLEV